MDNSAMKPSLVFYCLVLFLLPDSVYAHGVFKGLSSFYNGLLHPLFVPAQIMLILTLGLLLGKQDDKTHRAFFSFIAAVIIALLINALSTINTLNDLHREYLLIAMTLIAALFVIIQQRLPTAITIIIMSLGGFFIGLDSSTEQLIAKEKWSFLLGNIVAVYLLILYPITLAETFNKAFWQEVAIRILGSWLAASALMVAALSLA
ncbi:MAG: hypothetical protein DSZ29_06975 [Aquificaceae bacterium]|nr:MAG: hypothetical protein DSZ29_06975 [Aquificaceae bacterium]